MEAIQLTLAVVLCVLCMIMFLSSIFTPSPLQSVVVMLLGVMFLISVFGVRITYKEFKEVYNGNKK